MLNIKEIAKLYCDTEVLRTVLAANYCLELSKLDGISAYAYFDKAATKHQRLWVVIKNFNYEDGEHHMIIRHHEKTVIYKKYDSATGDIAIKDDYKYENGEWPDEVFDIKYCVAETPQYGMYYAAATLIDGLLYVLSRDTIDFNELLGDYHNQEAFDKDIFSDECAEYLRALGYDIN